MTPYYEQDGITIYHGDCREILPSIGRVDHVITDPPYSEHVHSKARSNAGIRGELKVRINDLGFSSLSPALRQFCSIHFARCAKRWVLAFSDVESAHEWHADMECAGLDYVRTGIWVKENSPPQFSGDRPAPGFEAVTIMHAPGRKAWNGGGHHAVWQHPIVPPGNCRVHRTQKPVSLMNQLVSLFTDEGELILDPFMGSGTTLLAAKQMRRKAIGVEEDEICCEVAAKRLMQTSLLGLLDHQPIAIGQPALSLA